MNDISLRDYFAAAALAGVQMNNTVLQAALKAGMSPAQFVSQAAYDLADAMLAERSKP